MNMNMSLTMSRNWNYCCVSDTLTCYSFLLATDACRSLPFPFTYMFHANRNNKYFIITFQCYIIVIL